MYFCHLNSTLIWEKHREEGGKMTEEKKNQTGPDGFGFNLWNPQNILKPRRNLSLKQGYLKLYQKWNTEVMDRGACLVCLEERSSRGIKRQSCPQQAQHVLARSSGHRSTDRERLLLGGYRQRKEPATWQQLPGPLLPPLAHSDCVQLLEFLFYFFFFLSKIAQNNNINKNPPKRK